jgi:putative DNA primase/helicase
MNLSAYSVGDVLPTRHGGRLKVTGYGPEFLLCDDGGAWVVVEDEDGQAYATPYSGDVTGYVTPLYPQQTRTKGKSDKVASGPAADNPTQPPGPTAALLPVIIANNRQLRELSDDAYSVLLAANNPPQVYQYGGQLARVTAADGRAGVQLLDPTMLRYRLSRVADFMAVKMLKDGAQQPSWVIPSDRLIADILAYPEWPDMPALSGVVTGPVVGPSGQVRVEAGYDPATGLYYHAGDALEIGDIEPTPERVAWAVGLILDDLLGDFPFKDAASRANAVALLLLPFARPSIEGCTPLHILNAPTPGTGKTLAARVATLPFNPDGPSVMTAGQDEDEWRKRITSLLSGGTSHLLIDNIKGALVSGSLAAALSTPLWTDRILGKSQTITLPNRAVWIATGNNIAVDTEMARRSVWIRLDSNAERPWTRNGFKHASLGEWALENRGDLVTAALVVIRQWFTAGCPPGRPTIGGFESWARVIGGILDAAGIVGFMGNAEELYEQSDPTAAQWAAFVAEWWKQYQDAPIGVKELSPLADSEPADGITGLGLLDTMLTGHTARARKVRLGNLLHSRLDTVVDGFKIQSAGTLRRASLYQLARLGV